MAGWFIWPHPCQFGRNIGPICGKPAVLRSIVRARLPLCKEHDRAAELVTRQTMGLWGIPN